MRRGTQRNPIGSWLSVAACLLAPTGMLVGCGDGSAPNPPPHDGTAGTSTSGAPASGGASGTSNAGHGAGGTSNAGQGAGGTSNAGHGAGGTSNAGQGTSGGTSAAGVAGDAFSSGGNGGTPEGAAGEAGDVGQGGAGAPATEVGGTSTGAGGAGVGGAGAGGVGVGGAGGTSAGTAGNLCGSSCAGSGVAGSATAGSGAGGGTAGSGGVAGSGGGMAGSGGSGGQGNDCIHVAAEGDDTAAAASGGLTPFASVQAAIDYAGAHPAGSASVCVAEGIACGTSATYAGPTGADLTMRDGISVYGNYESSGWTRCTTGTTTLAPGSAAGVYFPSSVQHPTTLDGVTIVHFSAPTTNGVTLDGAHGVTLSNLIVLAPQSATTVVGIDASAGAVATVDTVTLSNTNAGGSVFWAASQFGYRAVGAALGIVRSHAFLTTNTQTGPSAAVGTWFENAAGSSFTASTVRIGCSGGQFAAVHVEHSDGVVLDGTTVTVDTEGDDCQPTGAEILDSQQLKWSGGGVSVAASGIYAVLLDTSPGAALDLAITALRAPFVGVEVRGAAGGTTIAGSVSSPGTGIELRDCAGGALSVNATVQSQALGSGNWDGIHVTGDCIADLETQLTLTDLGIGGTQTLSGIHCEGASRCTVHDSNVAIANTATNSAIATLDAEGIRCDSGSCTTIERSTVLSLDKPGVEHRNSQYVGGGISAPGSTLVSANWIDARCTGSNGTGLIASGRIENNRILGPSCGGNAVGTNTAAGLMATGPGPVDIHSNTIDGNGALDGTSVSPPFNAPSCRSVAVVPNGGNLRNNILDAGICTPSVAIQTYPYFLENNQLLASYYLYSPTTIGGSDSLTTIDQINARPFASGNITAGSTIDAGTTTGAPATDRVGNPRDAHPDIGDLEATE